jgi:hypothetical protein
MSGERGPARDSNALHILWEGGGGNGFRDSIRASVQFTLDDVNKSIQYCLIESLLLLLRLLLLWHGVAMTWPGGSDVLQLPGRILGDISEAVASSHPLFYLQIWRHILGGLCVSHPTPPGGFSAYALLLGLMALASI